ncbi:hypothetical protein P171DRAFT_486290 [Karstenula rhodostoma CBS 690.94]|uniref:Uncharacterized protein n=1 Tax=Karstenula rhodostoma CBS 690.94 TaxID=1392251 RepID=A0A9P4PIL8_9PLEO|nr:hypothetical protein P171DRAFT_486290 [Karstenula rhodostoma CBS 690.94]
MECFEKVGRQQLTAKGAWRSLRGRKAEKPSSYLVKHGRPRHFKRLGIMKSVMGVHAFQSQFVLKACVARNAALWQQCAASLYAPFSREHVAGLVQATGIDRLSFANRSNALSDLRRKSTSHSQTAAYLSPVTRSTDTGPRALQAGGCLGR